MFYVPVFENESYNSRFLDLVLALLSTIYLFVLQEWSSLFF